MEVGEDEKEFMNGDVGEDEDCVEDGGRVSQDRVRRQDCRIRENDVGPSGSWVEV